MYKIIMNGNILVEDVTSATVNLENNKVGTCKFTITVNNPLYNQFEKLKTEISVIDSTSDLIFDGRVLEINTDFFNNKTILCESSFSYFNDSVALVYDYQGDLKGYIAKLLEFHNSQVEDNRKIYLGEITVRDDNDYLHYSDINAPSIMELLNKKVIEKYGGYMMIRKKGGKNYLDYLDEIPIRIKQPIELGVNLLDLVKESMGSEIYTVVYPTGARQKVKVLDEEGEEHEEEGNPLTIETVNNGSVFVEDAEAIKKYGRIVKHVAYDNVNEPVILKNKAIKDLGNGVLDLEKIEIKAVDTSLVGSADSFKLLRWVSVKSGLHGVNEHYLIEKLSLDLLRPENNTISIGRTQERLGDVIRAKYEDIEKPKDGKDGKDGRDGKDGKDGKDVAISSQTEPYDKTYLWLDISIEPPLLKRWNGTEWQVVNSQDEVKAQIVELENKTNATIEKTSNSILQKVNDDYYLKGEAEELVKSFSTEITQTADAIQINFDKFEQNLQDLSNNTSVRFQDISEYIRFENGEIELGKRGNQFKLRLTKEKISFIDGGSEVAYMSNNKLYITDGEFLNSLQLGKFAFIPRQNGNLSFRKEGV